MLLYNLYHLVPKENILHQLGMDHTRLSFLHKGRQERLTDPEVTQARVVSELLG